jgi:hypothetical protein
MNPEADWNAVRGERPSVLGMASMGVLRVTLLFGSAAVAMALILAPIADSQTRSYAGTPDSGVDRMTTGSTVYRGSYTIRRSVLQKTPETICIIRDNGTRSGDCR